MFMYPYLPNEPNPNKHILPSETGVHMALDSERTLALLLWCQQNGTKIDPRLKMMHSEHGGLGIFACAQIDAPACCESCVCH
jgi:hypothetical protein